MFRTRWCDKTDSVVAGTPAVPVGRRRAAAGVAHACNCCRPWTPSRLASRLTPDEHCCIGHSFSILVFSNCTLAHNFTAIRSLSGTIRTRTTSCAQILAKNFFWRGIYSDIRFVFSKMQAFYGNCDTPTVILTVPSGFKNKRAA